MKILFHGASVTEQKDTTGFFENVVILNQERSYEFHKCGYGGCHLEDGAFATIDADSNGDYSICFLDWNTTGNPEFEQYKLKYIVETLLNKKTLPVFLIFPRTETLSKDRTCEIQVKQICEEYDLLCLDYRNHVDPQKHLRDFVHTNTAGGMLYAKLITRDLPNARNQYLLREWVKYTSNEIKIETVDVDIKCYENEELVFNALGTSPYTEIIVEHFKAPYSPVINNNGIRQCLWDAACHYERRDYLCLKPNIDGDCITQVLDEVIDYSSCRREGFSYDEIKYLNIKKIYYVNAEQQVYEVRKTKAD